MQDEGIAYAFANLKPGMRDSDLAAHAQFYSQQHGSEQGVYLCSSYSPGKPHLYCHRHLQDRVIEKGDYVSLLIEDSGPGGQFTELGRTAVLGKVSSEAQDEFEFVLKARDLTADLLRPGMPSQEIWEKYNTFMRENGRPEERRLYCHGQGYDLVERPLVRWDESMKIAEGMNIAVHPTYLNGTNLNWSCDNYLIENGRAVRLHKFPEKIIEVN
jgi:Xaa-Pro aminopeptidase